MPTVQFGKRAGRTRGRPENRATADGSAVIDVRSAGTDEVEEAQIVSHNAYGGTFTLTDGTDTTGNLDFDATAGEVEIQVETFTSVTAAECAGSDGGPWTVTFEDDLGDIDLMTGSAASLVTSSVTFAESVQGVANVYQITSLETDADTGNITFSFGGNDSASTAFNANSGTVDTNVTGITGVTDVSVTGAGTSVSPWLVTFADPAGNAGPLTINITSATLAASTTIATPTPGVDEVDQIVELDNDSTSGTFTILFDGEETDPLTFDAAASLVKQELQELSGITDVTVTGAGTDANPWIVTFVDPPAAVATFTADDSNLNGGATTTVINVTQTGLDRVDEIQSIHVNAADGGTFTVTHGGSPSAAIAFDEEGPTDLKAILEGLGEITTVNVTGTGQSGDPWLIEFINPSGAEDVVTTSDSLTTTATATVSDTQTGVDAVNEQQVVTLNNATGGTFTLTYSGNTTSALTFDDTAADVETALEVLGSITAVTVTGSDGGPFTVEFVDPGGADLSMMTAASSLTGVAAAVTVTASVTGVTNVNETQEIVVDGDTGTFTLSYAGQTTAAIAYSANAALIDTRLTALSNINDVAVTGDGSRKNPFVVVFTDPVGDVAKITSTVSSLTNTVVVAARATGSSSDRE